MADTLLAVSTVWPLLQAIAKRKDVSPTTGSNFADTTNKKYPLDSAAHVRSAWSYINMPRNSGKYSSKDLATMKAKIKKAAGKYGITISDDQAEWVFPINPELQDHRTMGGSLEELANKIKDAFYDWCKCPEDTYDSDYHMILGIFADKIVYYTSGRSNDWGCDYATVSYTVDDMSCVTILDDVEAIDVTMVATSLTTEDDTMEKMDEQSTQDSSESPTVVETAKSAGTSADSPTVGQPKSDAESPGASVPDTSDDATEPTDAEKSDDDGAGPMASDGHGIGDVAGALGKTAAGVKQDFYGKEEFLIQSANKDLADQPISYITLQGVEEKSDGSKLMKIQGIATRGDIVNSKGEVYPTSIWRENLGRMNEQATSGKFLGKVEHPEVEQGLSDAAIKFEKFWMQDSDLWFDATVIPTDPYGKNLQALIESGVQIDLSSRGYGQFAQSDWRGQKRKVMQTGFVCTAFDAVWMGASTGSGVKTVSYQSDESVAPTQGDKTVENDEKTVTQSAEDRASAIRAQVAFAETKKGLLAQSGLSEIGQKAYQTALDKRTDITSLMAASDAILPPLQAVFPVSTEEPTVQSKTYSPVFYTKQSQEEIAPQTVGQMIDRLVADLPDHYVGQNKPAGNVPTHLTSPREACRLLLQNTARLTDGAFHGPSAARALLALEQGKSEIAQDILTQGVSYMQSSVVGETIADATDGVNSATGGAPISNYLIFPLIRRVFPQYILNEIASIQPMDRPNGKIFWLDQYRTADPTEGTDYRIDLNTSASPFNTSYADNVTENAVAKIIRMKLSSQTVDAVTKKLGAAWSIEEMQDLRAYHGLDAAQELLSGVARELALEVNAEVLNDMIDQQTAGNLTFGTAMPASGFNNQPEWDGYIWNYLQKMDNIIFGKRNGAMTHIICGMDAALVLAKLMRGAFTIGGDASGDGSLEGPYPGTTFFPAVNAPNGSRYRVIKTNFWRSGSANGAKMMCFRKGTEWNDTPYIYAPYADYTTPMLTDPLTFDQKQGVMTRYAKKVVTPDAIGTITTSATAGTLV
jgi:hypothetical protein